MFKINLPPRAKEWILSHKRPLGIAGAALVLLALAAVWGLKRLSAPARPPYVGLDAPALSGPACEVANPAACSPDRICVLTRPGHGECVRRYTGPIPLVRLPFDPNQASYCTQGPESAGRSHEYIDTVYAVDLATPKSEPARPVYSVANGIAVVNGGCPNDGSRPRCGGGFGNHVRVLDLRDGLVFFYAHLGKIDVQDGQIVHMGTRLGVEGRSGSAGYRHLHFSVHLETFESWTDRVAEYRAHPNQVPPSVPFEALYCEPTIPYECLRRRSRVEQLPCLARPPTGPGSLKGAVPLRSDWREN